MIVLVRRAKAATYKRYAGQAGSAEVALQMLPKKWVSSPVIAANRQPGRRAPHPRPRWPGADRRGRARPGQATAGQRGASKHERVAYGVTVTTVVMGNKARSGAAGQARRPHPEAAQDAAAEPDHRHQAAAAGAGRGPAHRSRCPRVRCRPTRGRSRAPDRRCAAADGQSRTASRGRLGQVGDDSSRLQRTSGWPRGPWPTWSTPSAISIAFGTRTLLDEVSLGLGRGDVVGVVGRNGDGKTTLLRVLTGVREPDSGRVMRTGVDLDRLPAPGRRLRRRPRRSGT